MNALFFLPVFGVVTVVYLARPDSPALAQCNIAARMNNSIVNDGLSWRRGFNVNCDQGIASYNFSYYTGPLGKDICRSTAGSWMFEMTYPIANASDKGQCVWKVKTTAGDIYRFGLRIGDGAPFELTPEGMEEAVSSEGEEKQ